MINQRIMNSNLFSICKPNGIIAKKLYIGRKVVFLCLILALLIDFLTWLPEIWTSTNKRATIDAIIYSVYRMIYATFLCLFYRNRNGYIECLSYFESQVTIVTLCSSLAHYLKKNRLIITIIISLGFACYCATGIYFSLDIFATKDNYYIKLLIIERIIGFVCPFIFLHFFLETCLYIQCCFIQVEYQIDTLKESGTILTVSNVRQLRLLYCAAIENTKKLNSLFLPVTGFYFIISIVQSHFTFVHTIAVPSFYMIITCISEFGIFSLSIYHMIYINHLATAVYEKVYFFSFKTDSLNVIKEVQLLLTRITRADVGLTFLNIFVITPDYVSSLTAISLTIALATPTLIKYVNF